jgi:hypothetical protein
MEYSGLGLYGIAADQELVGSISASPPSYVAAVTGFTEDLDSCWQTIRFGGASSSSVVYIAGEPCSGGVRICGSGTAYSAPTEGNSYFDSIYWDFSSYEWHWYSAACSNYSVTWSPGNDNPDFVKGAGSVDMMESTDTNHNDFTSYGASAYFVAFASVHGFGRQLGLE